MIVTIELWANREGGILEDIQVPDVDPIDIQKLSQWLLNERFNARNRMIAVGDVIRFQKQRYMIGEEHVLKLDKAS